MTSFRKNPLALCLGLGISLSLFCSPEILAAKSKRPLTITTGGQQTTVTLVIEHEPPEGESEASPHTQPGIGLWGFSVEPQEGQDLTSIANVLPQLQQQHPTINIQDAGDSAITVSTGGDPEQTLTNLLTIPPGQALPPGEQAYYIPGLPNELFPTQGAQVKKNEDGSFTITHPNGQLIVTIENGQLATLSGTLPANQDAKVELGPALPPAAIEEPLQEENGDEAEAIDNTGREIAQSDEAGEENIAPPPAAFRDEQNEGDEEAPQLEPVHPATPMPQEGQAFDFGVNTENMPAAISEEPDTPSQGTVADIRPTLPDGEDRNGEEASSPPPSAEPLIPEIVINEPTADNLPDSTGEADQDTTTRAADVPLPGTPPADDEHTFIPQEAPAEVNPVGGDRPLEGGRATASSDRSLPANLRAEIESRRSQEPETQSSEETGAEVSGSRSLPENLRAEIESRRSQDPEGSTDETPAATTPPANDEAVTGDGEEVPDPDPQEVLADLDNTLDGQEEPEDSGNEEGSRRSTHRQESDNGEQGTSSEKEATGGQQSADLDRDSTNTTAHHPEGATGTIDLQEQLRQAQMEIARDLGPDSKLFDQGNPGN